MFDDQKIKNVTTEQDAIMMTGIAGNKEMEVYLNKNFKTIKNISFSDHHYFTDDNIKFIQLRSEGKIIITTEKDAMRLMEKKETILQQGLSIFVLPIEIKFLEDKEVFSDKVINYIKSYANAESASN
ncbi:MAG: tetraacyldisaccharide 4'-kinase [Bacteroidetes bacterium]|nr:tetraacyldisaccharide 4'-kinase [Bacteroidota bacterium]